MIESEAKTKWCPMVRDVVMESGRLTVGSGFCKASDCMMWRVTDRGYQSAEWESVGGDRVRTTIPSEGYCGLASTPPMSVKVADLSPPMRRVGKGVYNNPQPGDTDFPGG